MKKRRSKAVARAMRRRRPWNRRRRAVALRARKLRHLRRRRGRHLPLRLLIERRDRLEQLIGSRMARGR